MIKRQGQHTHRHARSTIQCFVGIMVISVITLNQIINFATLTHPPSFTFHPDWHPAKRIERFPTVEQRVKLYMSNWYHPPCPNASFSLQWTYDTKTGNGRRSLHLNMSNWNDSSEMNHHDHSTTILENIITPDRTFFLDLKPIQDCAQVNRRRRSNMPPYCRDCIDFLEMMNQSSKEFSNTSTMTPVLGQFGDGLASSRDNFPLVSKFRIAATKEAVANITLSSSQGHATCIMQSRPTLQTMEHGYNTDTRMSPIVWKLESARHWGPLEPSRRDDIPWEQKKDGALWRGALTGGMLSGTYSDVEICRSNTRCRFVLDHATSKLINAGLHKSLGHIGNVVNGVRLVKRGVSRKAMLQHKVIVSMEGNDVATGLKWSLLSQSVLIMSRPTRTSWAMEELLEPWVHYIPMNANGSNAEDMVQWVKDNDEMAHRIAERATLFMYDMVYHPDAAREEREVKEEIVRRYQALWSHSR